MNQRHLCSVCEGEMECAPSEINWYILAVHVSSEWMAGTLQHYLMPCFYFSHVSLSECSLKITAQ